MGASILEVGLWIAAAVMLLQGLGTGDNNHACMHASMQVIRIIMTFFLICLTHSPAGQSLTVSIAVDYTPPTDTILGVNEYRAASTILLTCLVEGANETFIYTWDSTLGEQDNNQREGMALLSSDTGNHTCMVTDGVGNTGNASAEIIVVGMYLTNLYMYLYTIQSISNANLSLRKSGDVLFFPPGAGIYVIVGDHSIQIGALPNNSLIISNDAAETVRFHFVCRSSSSSSNVGELLGLDGSAVSTGSFFAILNVQVGTVDVQNNNGHTAVTAMEQGVYTCHIPDEAGETVDVNIGIYPNGFNSEWDKGISSS